jgi:hypothetical protein
MPFLRVLHANERVKDAERECEVRLELLICLLVVLEHKRSIKMLRVSQSDCRNPTSGTPRCSQNSTLDDVFPSLLTPRAHPRRFRCIDHLVTRRRLPAIGFSIMTLHPLSHASKARGVVHVRWNEMSRKFGSSRENVFDVLVDSRARFHTPVRFSERAVRCGHKQHMARRSFPSSETREYVVLSR